NGFFSPSAGLNNTGTITGIGPVHVTGAFTNSGLFNNAGSFSSSGDVVNTGTFQLSGPQNWSFNTTFTNHANQATFLTDAGPTTTAPLNIILNTSSITFGQNQHLTSLTLTGGIAAMNTSASFHATLVTNAFTLAGSTHNWLATLDLNASDMLI